MNLNAQLETLTEGDSELANIVIATGPGDGIQAMQLVVRDEASIEQYGEYPKPVTFAGAVSESDLRTLAQKYLEQHSGPLESLSVKAVFEEGYDPDIECGDTVTFASREAGIVVTERIVELSYDADGVTFSLKAPAADLTSAILDQMSEEDRKQRALGLPAPQSFTCIPARPGVRLKFNPFVGSRAQGVEIHASLEPNFEADANTFVKRTSDTELQLSSVPHLPLGARWYVKVAAYAGAERGEFTEELSAIAGYITTDVLDPSIEEALDQVAADERIAELLEEVAAGHIFVGTLTSWSVDSISDTAKDFVAEGVQAGWSLKFLSGPLKYRAYTVLEVVSRTTVRIDPTLGSGLLLAGSEYEIASSPRITTLGTTGIVVELSKPPGESTFSSIKQMSDEIALSVVRDAEQYSQIALLRDEVDIRVVKGDMISAINLDPAGVRITGGRIQLNGDTQVSGNLAITGGVSGSGNRMRVLDSGNGEQVAVGYISGRPWGSGTLPVNTWGVWGQKAGVYLRGVPRIVAVGEQQFQLSSQTLSPGERYRWQQNFTLTDIEPFQALKGEQLVTLIYPSAVGLDLDIVGLDVAPRIDTGSGFVTTFVEHTFAQAEAVERIGAFLTLDGANSRSFSVTEVVIGRFVYQVYLVG